MPSNTGPSDRFARDERGAVAIIFGLSFMALCYCAAMAWDSSRLHNIQTQVQEALDAAALAGAKELDPDNFDPQKVRDVATAFFNARTSHISVHDAVVSAFDAVPNLDERSVETTANIRMNSFFGALAGGSGEIDIQPWSKTKHVRRKVEVALVLDVTGSMSGTRIADLKVAAKNMIDTLYSNSPEAGAIRVSLVPYSAAVNVGSTYFEDVAAYSGATDTCVVEREGLNTYTNAAPVSGSLFETTGNTDPDWLTSYRCPAPTIVPLTDLATTASRDAFKAQIDALTTDGWTAGHIGLAWGWYTLSPEWTPIWPTESDPKPYREDVIKVVVLMTDGIFNTAYWNDGHTYSGDDRKNPLLPGTAGYQALQLCGNIKDRVAQPYGPTIYTVNFLGGPEADALLEQCAGAGNAYAANNLTTLTAAFTSIVERLTSLALTQ